ncbi:MAG: DUF3524 domain-containing protein [Leptospirillia bacterium]
MSTPPADTSLDILALEPWYAGSHKDFLDGLIAHSRHRIRPYTLAGRFWKWRQSGSGLILANRVLMDRPLCDLVFSSDFTHLSDFMALTRKALPNAGVVVYFHENQLSYPLLAEHRMDKAYAHFNMSAAAVADQVWFNSPYHMESFFSDLEQLLIASPDHRPRGLEQQIADKARVMPLGVDLAGLAPPPGSRREGPLTLLWNHRWEHDKNPEAFFNALFTLADEDVPFEVIVCGQSFRRMPEVFDTARERLGERIVHWGYEPDRAVYAGLLARADVVVSMARHDFFGVSVVEAMHAGCLPLLANRLNYPNLVPEAEHNTCLVADEVALKRTLRSLAKDPAPCRDGRATKWVASYDWAHMAPRFDAAFRDAGE